MWSKSISEKQANEIYDILYLICGAREEERNSFIENQTAIDFPNEWRFCGILGFGGKFWRNNGKIYVSCYQEDLSDERQEIITAANICLGNLYNK